MFQDSDSKFSSLHLGLHFIILPDFVKQHNKSFNSGMSNWSKVRFNQVWRYLDRYLFFKMVFEFFSISRVLNSALLGRVLECLVLWHFYWSLRIIYSHMSVLELPLAQFPVGQNRHRVGEAERRSWNQAKQGPFWDWSRRVLIDLWPVYYC
jgi:hypothetical protein